jgi:hypothetical protein
MEESNMKIRAIALGLALVSGSAFAAEPAGSTVALGMTSGQLIGLGVTVLVVGGAAAAANGGGSGATGTVAAPAPVLN